MYSVLQPTHGAIKHRNQIWAAILGTFIVGLGATVSVQAAPRQRACAEIRSACEQAGFVQGGARSGDGLFVDCVAHHSGNAATASSQQAFAADQSAACGRLQSAESELRPA
jgi:hypothetical protein